MVRTVQRFEFRPSAFCFRSWLAFATSSRSHRCLVSFIPGRSRRARHETARFNRQTAAAEENKTADLSRQTNGTIRTHLRLGIEQAAGKRNEAGTEVDIRS